MPGTVAIPAGTISSNLPNYQNYNTGLASVDYYISDKDQLRGRFILERTGSIDTAGFPQAFFHDHPRQLLFGHGFGISQLSRRA